MASKKRIVAGAGLILIAAIIGGVLVGWWIFRNVDAHLLLSNQAATVSLLGEIPAEAKVLNNLDITLDSKIKTSVPVDQTISVPIKDTLHVHVSFDHDVPIRMNVPVHTQIPVDQVVPVDSKVRVDVLGVPITLPIKGNVPIKAEIPVNLMIPVDQQVHLKFTAPADVTLDEPLRLPLKTDINTTVPIHAHLSVPVESELKADVRIPGPLKAVIHRADLDLPLHTLRLTMAGNHAKAAPASAASAVSAAAAKTPGVPVPTTTTVTRPAPTSAASGTR